MLPKYSIYGTCQAWAINTILKTCTGFTATYGQCLVKPYFDFTDAEFETYLTTVCPQLELFIYLPISDRIGKRSTNNIIKHLSPTCKKIVFPRCYFSAYHPDGRKIKDASGKYITALDVYHNVELVSACQMNDLNIFQMITTYDQYYSQQFLERLVDVDIDQLKKREDWLHRTVDSETHVIEVSEYIRDNYRNAYLFYTFNHPSKQVLHHIIDRILAHLGIADGYNTSIDPISTTQLPIFESVRHGLQLQFKTDVFAKMQTVPYTVKEYLHQMSKQYTTINLSAFDDELNKYRTLVNELSTAQK